MLNRKCGLIWLASASILAASSSFSCSCSRCSIRALFQILIGVATQRTVASSTASIVQRDRQDPVAEVNRPVMRSPADAEDLPQQLEPDRRQQQDDLPVHLQGSKHLPRAPVQAREDERARSARSLPSGQSSRRPPPAKPQPIAKGRAISSPPTSGGKPTRVPTVAPAYGPAISPATNDRFEREIGSVVLAEAAGRLRPRPAGCPRLSAKTSRSGQFRRSKIRIWRKRRYLTSIVAKRRHDREA